MLKVLVKNCLLFTLFSADVNSMDDYYLSSFVKRYVFTDGIGKVVSNRHSQLLKDISELHTISPKKIVIDSKDDGGDDETVVFQVKDTGGKKLYYFNESDKSISLLTEQFYLFPKIETHNETHIYWSGVIQGDSPEKQIYAFSKKEKISERVKLPFPFCSLSMASSSWGAFLYVAYEGGRKGSGIYYQIFDKDKDQHLTDWSWKLLAEDLDSDHLPFFGLKYNSLIGGKLFYIKKLANDGSLQLFQCEGDCSGLQLREEPFMIGDVFSNPFMEFFSVGEIDTANIWEFRSFLKDGKLLQTGDIYDPLNKYVLSLQCMISDQSSDSTKYSFDIYRKEDSLFYEFISFSENKVHLKVESDRVPANVIEIVPSDEISRHIYKFSPKNEFLLIASIYFVNHEHYTIPTYKGDPEFGCLIWKPLLKTFGSGPYPAIVIPHGGPSVEEDCLFNRKSQFLVNRGYVVISPIYSGSTNNLPTYLNGRGELSGRVQREMNRAVSYFSRSKVIDAERVGICGASFGGYVSLYQATHPQYFFDIFPQGFKCAVSLNGISDFLQYVKYFKTKRYDKLATENQIQYFEPLIESTTEPFSEAAVLSMKKKSPLTYAKDVKTPLLILQGAKDKRVDRSHGDKISSALTDAGISHTYGVFKGEGHNFDKAENYDAYLALLEKFFAKYLGGLAEPLGDSLEKSTIEFISKVGDNV